MLHKQGGRQAGAREAAPGGRVVLAREPPRNLGDLTLHPAHCRLAAPDGRSVHIEPRVAEVLVALSRANGRVLTRAELIAACWKGLNVGDDAISRGDRPGAPPRSGIRRRALCRRDAAARGLPAARA